MREKTKRTSVLSAAVGFWISSIILTLVAIWEDAPAWDAVLPINVGAAVAATIARFLMRTRHTQREIYLAGRDAGREEDGE